MLIASSTTKVSACGGVICRWCAHHHGVRAVRGPVYYAAPSQYYVVPSASPTSNGGDVSRLTLGDIGQIAGIYEAILSIRGRRVNPPGDGGPPTSSADLNAINGRLDALLKTSEQQQQQIAELVKTESEVANKVDGELEKIAELVRRVDTLEPKVKEVSDTVSELSSKLNGIDKATKRQILAIQLSDKKSQKDALEERLKSLGKPNNQEVAKNVQLLLLRDSLAICESAIKNLEAQLKE